MLQAMSIRDRLEQQAFSGESDEAVVSVLVAANHLDQQLSTVIAAHGIAAAYAERYRVSAIVVHNTFPLPSTPPDLHPHPERRLRLYWFSQTIGPGRGLEDVVSAMALAAVPGELHLRGLAIAEYVERLRRLAAQGASRLLIVPHAPAPPDTMVGLCADHDVGLSLERGPVLNKLLCLSNKALTYVLGGLAVVLTDTPGQRPLAQDLGEGSLLYAPGDVASLAAGFSATATRTLPCRQRGIFSVLPARISVVLIPFARWISSTEQLYCRAMCSSVSPRSM